MCRTYVALYVCYAVLLMGVVVLRYGSRLRLYPPFLPIPSLVNIPSFAKRDSRVGHPYRVATRYVIPTIYLVVQASLFNKGTEMEELASYGELKVVR